MEKKHIIIIIVAVILAAIAGYILTQPQYQTIQLSESTTIDVPQGDGASWKHLGYGFKTYICPKKHFFLTSFNDNENKNILASGGFDIASSTLLTGAQDTEIYNGYPIKENGINNTVFYIASIENNSTKDNIVIASDNLDILKHSLDTLKFKNPETPDINITQANASNLLTTTNELMKIENWI